MPIALRPSAVVLTKSQSAVHGRWMAAVHSRLARRRVGLQKSPFADRRSAMLSDDNQKMVTQHLSSAKELTDVRRVSVVPSIAALASLDNDFPNFSSVTALIRRHTVLSGLTSERICTLPPIILDGPPGIGKTIYCKRLASVLALPYFEVDGATLTAGFALSGLDVGWASSKPGLIWDALQNACMSPLFVLDELDKASSEGKYNNLGFLYGLLERHSARRFQDAALRFPIDASHIKWIATCNDLARIEAPLVSRFSVVRVEAPIIEQMPSVIASIHADILHGAEWAAAFDPVLNQGVIQCLCELTPREIRKGLEGAYATAAEAGRRHLIASDVDRSTPATKTRPMGFLV